MKKSHIYDIHEKEIDDLIIPADKVAHVQIGNPLEHALLVLIKTGYSAIPVLNTQFKLKGLISKTLILDYTLGMERMEFEKLNDHYVEEVMRTDLPYVKEADDFLQALKLTIDHNFLCVVNGDGIFTGIITRSAILKFVNHYLRQLSRETVGQK
jgi:predicted transcriptional regulator